MSSVALYNDQGGAETAVEAGQESSPSTSSTGAAFGLFSADFKNAYSGGTEGEVFAHQLEVGNLFRPSQEHNVVSRPHPSDNPALLLFLVGGVTPSELRLIKEVVSALKPATQVLVMATRLLRPTDLPEMLFATRRLTPDIGV